MRNKFLILFLSFLISVSSFAQRGMNGFAITKKGYGGNYGSSQNRGVYGYAGSNIAQNIIDDGYLGTDAGWKGYHVTINWSDIETSDNVFSWAVLDGRINAVKARILLVGVQGMVGEDCPTWLKTLAGTFTTTRDTYPKYYNPVYKTRYYRFLRKLAEHIASVGGVLEWQITEGTTGDEQAWHGTLTSGIGDPFVPQTPSGDDWQDFRHIAWDSVKIDYALYNVYPTHLLFNTGNDARDVDLIAGGYFGDAWGKKGDASHGYQFDGMGLYIERQKVLSRGECQGTILSSAHPNKDLWMQVVSAASANIQLDIFNTGSDYYTSLAGTDTRFNSFFNKYANDTVVETSRKAFIKLGLLISIDSTAYWTQGTYGNLISNTTAYNNAITNINNSLVDSPSYKAVRRMRTTVTYTNATRTTNLTNNTGTTAINNYPTDVDYDNDFVYSGTQNWSKWITENAPFTHSFPMYRLTPDTSIYGRFAKQFAAPLVANTSNISFDIAENWDFGAVSDDVTMSIVYQDAGVGAWKVVADTGTGMVTIQSHTNTNTGQFMQEDISISNMNFKVGEDFRIVYVSGANPNFDLIELEAANKLNQKPNVFLSQTEMTPSGGQVYDEFYWLNTNAASLTKTGLTFPNANNYRVDISAYKVAGNPIVNVLVDGVSKGTIAITSTTVGIFSLYVSSAITAGTNHTIALQLSNFSSGTNHCRIGLVYMTKTSQKVPYTYPVITPIDLTPGSILVANHFGSGHLRGFSLGGNGTNQPGENAVSMTAMKATGANIARCFVQIERLSGDTYTFKANELIKLDTTIARGARLGFYVAPVLFHDPSLNSDYWGTSASSIARRLSICNLWKTIANKYKGNATVAAYDLINEPRSNFNYAEVIRWETQMIDTIRTIDQDHVCMVECIKNDMFAMMLPLAYSNIVYSPHGYSPLNITHQGVAGNASANIRNVYPTITPTANQGVFGITQLSAQHDDVRTLSHRFHVPVFVGEFSCVNWSPINGNSEWTSTKWIDDNISLLEAEGWSWVYHNWSRGGEAIEWDCEIPSSFYNSISFTGATPNVKASKNDESPTAPTVVMLESYFDLNQ